MTKCGFCHQPGHNSRTCGRLQAANIASMVAEEVAEEIVCRSLDVACPGSGLALQAIRKCYTGGKIIHGLASRTKAERQHAVAESLIMACGAK